MKITVPVYSEQELSPRAAEVLRSIVNDSYPDHQISFTEWDNRVDYGHNRVLVFGGRAPSAMGVQWIYTYSIAQMMTKANAASVIKAALRQFLEEPEAIPFRVPTRLSSRLLDSFDFDAPVVIDIETSGNLGKEDTPETVGIISVALYQPGMHEPRVIYGGWNVATQQSNDLDQYQIDDLAEFLPKFTKAIYHNGKFDVRVLNRVLGVKLHVWFDTMLAHHVLNIAAGDHKLKTLARRYLGAPEWEADLSKYTKGGGHYELIPMAELINYNGWDVYWTYKLWEFLAPQIEQDDANQTAFLFELAEAEFLLTVEDYGIPLDLDYAAEYDEKLSEDAEDYLNYLRRITKNEKFNPASPKQVKEWLTSEGWDYGKSDEETLNEILDQTDPDFPRDFDVREFCKTLLSYRKVKKIQGTYVNGWVNKSRNGRVHPTYLVHGTSTGRLSSTSPNAQNMPREKAIRKVVRTLGN